MTMGYSYGDEVSRKRRMIRSENALDIADSLSLEGRAHVADLVRSLVADRDKYKALSDKPAQQPTCKCKCRCCCCSD